MEHLGNTNHVAAREVSPLLEALTEPQRQAVVHIDGPLLVIAGPGSGKTRVITRRVAYLMSRGIPGPAIVAVTFTNKAAGEMKQRVGDVLGRPVRDFGRLDQPWPTICTFHSLCLRILRHYASQIGLKENFAIYDSSDQTGLIKEAIKACDLSTTNFPAGDMHAKISAAKNQCVTPEQYAENGRDFNSRHVARIYARYQKLLEQNNALDFDDLMLRTVQACRDFPHLLRQLQERYQYILIDEYQDTNRVQYLLAHALAQARRNICVVGDPDQSIYAWRGADIRNILEFERDYPDAKVVRLEQNYRSTKSVLAIADSLIAHNACRKKKRLWTENKTGQPADVFICQDEHDEAAAVTRYLINLHEKERIPWSGMAIFYRMNSLSRVVEESLFKKKVPYEIVRGVEFYSRKEIKDVLAYLRVIANPADDVSLDRIVNVPPRGLGDAAMKQIAAHSSATGRSLLEALGDASSIAALSVRARKSAVEFAGLIRGWRKMAGMTESASNPPVEQTGQPMLNFGAAGAVAEHTHSAGVRVVMEDVIRRGGLEALMKKADEGKEAGERWIDNVNELISSAAEFDNEHRDGSLVDYLAGVTLVSDTDRMSGSGAVTLMTLHAAKGLEFPVVAIIGLEENVLPHARTREHPGQLEEERRLCFVGITRAQERLLLSTACRRQIRGKTDVTTPSRFLGELPAEALHVVDCTGLSGHRQHDEAADQREEDLSDAFWEGQLVRHPSHGLGRIVEIGSGIHARVVIRFNTSGKKTFVLREARLVALE